MIKSWTYNTTGGKREDIKKYISDNNLKTVDVGASYMFWSYPECKFVADSIVVNKDDVTFFNLNLEDKTTWGEILSYVETYGKFDFSICSHTIEDVFNPLELTDLLTKISLAGFIASPSKYDEFSFLYQNKYRGNAHHKQFLEIINNEVVIFPKFSWIENDVRSDEILMKNKGKEISFFWEKEIPIKVFGNGIPFQSDSNLINEYYRQLDN
jgi:hypothetical protein